MKKIGMLFALTGLIAGGVFLFLDGETPIADVAISVSEVAPEGITWIKGKCEDVAVKQCVKTDQFDGMCGCYTAIKNEVVSEAIDIELTDPKDLHNLLWCKGGVQWQRADADIGDCQIILDKMPINKSIGYETEIEKALNVICAPCVVNPMDWGPCPHCLFDTKRFPGGCAEACESK